MSAWLDDLSADQRFELLREWLSLGKALLGLTDSEPAVDHIRELTEKMGLPLRQSECSLAVAADEPRRAENRAKATHKIDRRPNKVTPSVKARMFELFENGLTARQTYERLQFEIRPVPFAQATVSWWKCEWSKGKRSKPDQTVPKPTGTGQSRPREGATPDNGTSELAAGAAEPNEPQENVDPVPRPIFAQVSPEARRFQIQSVSDDEIAAWKAANEPVECRIPGMETLSLRACNSMRTERPSPYCRECGAWKTTAA